MTQLHCRDCGREISGTGNGRPPSRCWPCRGDYNRAYQAAWFQALKADPILYAARQARIYAARRGKYGYSAQPKTVARR